MEFYNKNCNCNCSKHPNYPPGILPEMRTLTPSSPFYPPGILPGPHRYPPGILPEMRTLTPSSPVHHPGFMQKRTRDHTVTPIDPSVECICDEHGCYHLKNIISPYNTKNALIKNSAYINPSQCIYLPS